MDVLQDLACSCRVPWVPLNLRDGLLTSGTIPSFHICSRLYVMAVRYLWWFHLLSTQHTYGVITQCRVISQLTATLLTCISWPARMGASFSNDTRCLSVCLSVCVSHANISETKRDTAMVTIKSERAVGVSDSESAIRFVTGSTVLPFWAFKHSRPAIVLSHHGDTLHVFVVCLPFVVRLYN